MESFILSTRTSKTFCLGCGSDKKLFRCGCEKNFCFNCINLENIKCCYTFPFSLQYRINMFCSLCSHLSMVRNCVICYREICTNCVKKGNESQCRECKEEDTIMKCCQCDMNNGFRGMLQCYECKKYFCKNFMCSGRGANEKTVAPYKCDKCCLQKLKIIYGDLI
jgi:hypothetical protein